MSDLQPQDILIYRTDDNRVRLEVKLEEKTIWLSQLFGNSEQLKKKAPGRLKG